MTTIYKPRTPKKPMMLTEGIRPNHLVQFLRDAQRKCLDNSEQEAAFRLDCLADYFEQYYNPNEPLRFKGMDAGF
jgi:hypothetical protein